MISNQVSNLQKIDLNKKQEVQKENTKDFVKRLMKFMSFVVPNTVVLGYFCPRGYLWTWGYQEIFAPKIFLDLRVLGYFGLKIIEEELTKILNYVKSLCIIFKAETSKLYTADALKALLSKN